MKLRNIIKLSLLAILLIGVGVVAWAVNKALNARIGPERVFSLDHRPEFLTEALALDIAQKTLKMSKYHRHWEPRKDGRSTAPDGRVDEYISRNGLNPNLATIMLASGDFDIIVSMELKGDRVVSQTVLPK
ncbi:MAG TPA: hypothetical protein PLN21_12360 [Gemmatales bacterium]|nr:hypothetical protein [Gemmatales bacterium]